MLNPLHLYRDAYRGLSPSVWVLSGVMLINRCGTMVLPYLTLYMTQELRFSVTQAGVVMALFGTGAVCGAYLGGQLTDRIGFAPVQLYSLLFGGLFLLGLQFVRSFPLLCVAVFCFTLLGDTFRPANSAAIAHYSNETTRTRAFSLNRLAINLGWAVGGGLGGYLASINYSLLFWIDGLTCVLAAVVLSLKLGLPRIRPATSATLTNAAQPTPPALRPIQDDYFLRMMGLVLFFICSFVLMFSLLPLYFKQVFGLSEAQIGGLMSLNGIIIVFIEMALVYALEQRWPLQRHKNRIISLGVGLTGLAYAVLTINTWAGWAVVTMLLLTVGEILAMPFMQASAVDRSNATNRGQYMAFYSMGWALSQLISPFLGTQTVAYLGFSALWWLAAGSCAISAGGFWWLSRQGISPSKG
jgi:predicted MFS family arabinose efflux permease